MEKPKLFKNSNLNIKNNNKEYCLLENINSNKSNVEEQLDKVFNSFNNIYNTKLLIKTNSKTYNTYLLSRTSNNIMTINREIIPISEIVEIQVK